MIVWKRGMALAKAAHLLSRKLPREEDYALADQIRRSSVSIPSNIAEGYGRTSTRDYARFLSMARGSGYELETQLLLSVDLGYLTANDVSDALALCREVSKILTRILARLASV